MFSGDKGSFGPNGIPGSPGLDGQKGNEGAPGLRGFEGVKGDKGNTGPAGFNGEKGEIFLKYKIKKPRINFFPKKVTKENLVSQDLLDTPD